WLFRVRQLWCWKSLSPSAAFQLSDSTRMTTFPDMSVRQLPRPLPQAATLPDVSVRQLQPPTPTAAVPDVSVCQLQGPPLELATVPDMSVLRSGRPVLNQEAGRIPIRLLRPLGESRVLSDRNWPPK